MKIIFQAYGHTAFDDDNANWPIGPVRQTFEEALSDALTAKEQRNKDIKRLKSRYRRARNPEMRKHLQELQSLAIGLRYGQISVVIHSLEHKKIRRHLYTEWGEAAWATRWEKKK